MLVNNQAIGHVYKAKRNTNGSFSIGKTWAVNDMRGMEVVGVSTQPKVSTRTAKPLLSPSLLIST